MTYVYILYNLTFDRYYIGSTSNLENRLKRHNGGQSKATKYGAPNWRMVYTESYENRALALRREYSIKKKKSRVYIEWLVKFQS